MGRKRASDYTEIEKQRNEEKLVRWNCGHAEKAKIGAVRAGRKGAELAAKAEGRTLTENEEKLWRLKETLAKEYLAWAQREAYLAEIQARITYLTDDIEELEDELNIVEEVVQ